MRIGTNPSEVGRHLSSPVERYITGDQSKVFHESCP
jgi:hypothetical protein